MNRKSYNFSTPVPRGHGLGLSPDMAEGDLP
jgi:hypothetical protein